MVFGVGHRSARLMIVGEASGKNEDLQGEPFVGPAGLLLDELLAGIDIARPEVYITNVLKCRPPANRDPKPDEIETCKATRPRRIYTTIVAVLTVVSIAASFLANIWA